MMLIMMMLVINGDDGKVMMVTMLWRWCRLVAVQCSIVTRCLCPTTSVSASWTPDKTSSTVSSSTLRSALSHRRRLFLASLYFAPGTGACNILWWVCLFVCLFVRSHNSKTTRPNFAIFCEWFDPPLTSLRYVMYFRFCGWHHKIKHSVLFEEVCQVAVPVWR